VPVPKGSLTISPDARQATLEIVTAVIDQPKWPEYDAPFVNAVMSRKVVWKATEEKVVVENKDKHFRFEGFRAIAQAEAKVSVPSLDFSWKSDPLAISRADFAVIGTEVNGKYFDEREKP
jgi:hypothetical protein